MFIHQVGRGRPSRPFWDHAVDSTSPKQKRIFSLHHIPSLGFAFVVQRDGEAYFIANLQPDHLIPVYVNVSGEAQLGFVAINEAIAACRAILESFHPPNKSLLVRAIGRRRPGLDILWHLVNLGEDLGRAGRAGRVLGATLGFTLLRPSSLKRILPHRRGRGLAWPRTGLVLAERRHRGLPLHVWVPLLGRQNGCTWKWHDRMRHVPRTLLTDWQLLPHLAMQRRIQHSSVYMHGCWRGRWSWRGWRGWWL